MSCSVFSLSIRSRMVRVIVLFWVWLLVVVSLDVMIWNVVDILFDVVLVSVIVCVFRLLEDGIV